MVGGQGLLVWECGRCLSLCPVVCRRPSGVVHHRVKGPSTISARLDRLRQTDAIRQSRARVEIRDRHDNQPSPSSQAGGQR